MKIQKIARIILGLFLTYAGVSHLSFNRMEFLAQVPNWVPMSADSVVILSGIVEITLGLSLILLVKQKRTVGLVTGLFFVAIFPGNIAQYMNDVSAFGLDTDSLRLGRLFFQPVLILWALWSTSVIGNRKNDGFRNLD